MSDATAGGTWASANTAVATVGVATGALYGVTNGTSNITYTLTTGCFASAVATVGPPLAGTISGPTSVCGGYTINLTETIPGGVWSCTNTNATITSGGVVTGVTAGIDTVNYTISTGCGTAVATHIVTITASAGTITGPSSVCVGSSITLSDAVSGGTWSSSAIGIARTGSTSSVVYGVSAGTATISYMLAGCGTTMYATTTITVDPLPTVTANATLASCGGIYTLTATGGATYSWTPSTGLSCSTCAITTVDPTTSRNYYVTGYTSAGCSASASTSVNGNRISGYITYSGGSSSDVFKVWLINYNPADSQIVALDSTLSCMSGGTPYYRFDNPPAGSYMVKAKLNGTIPGTSGYIPTYSLSSANWSTGATGNHVSSADTMHVNMIYGTVPAGSGFISGNVYAGAGRGTLGEVPVSGMLIFLKNTTSGVLTYTYTDGSGVYSFNNLAYSDYVIYPEEYSYYTTPSATITLNTSHPSASGVNFKQHTTFGTITPSTTTGVQLINNNAQITLFPNPTNGNLSIQWQDHVAGNADLVITDMLGRGVFKKVVNINAANGQTQVNLSGLKNGIYLITIKSDSIHISNELRIQK
jgi:hypothetical protein